MRRLIPYWRPDRAAFYAMGFCDTKLTGFLATIFHSQQKIRHSQLPNKKRLEDQSSSPFFIQA
jgi:hypothetical protein